MTRIPQGKIMEQSQLIELIQTLQPKEKEQILQFATLTFFNQGRMKAQVVPLLDICLNHPWHDPQQKLQKEEVFAALFPHQEFVEGKLEKVMVEAHKVVRAFLLVQYYFRKENEFHHVFDFSEIVRLKGLEGRYQQQLSRLQKSQEESVDKNERYFHRQFILEYAIHDDESLRNQKKGDLNIPNVLYALEAHYYLNRLALLNRFLLQQKIAALDAPEIIKSFLEYPYVPAIYLEESPSLRINFGIFNLLRKKNPESPDVRFLFNLLLFYEKSLHSASLREFYAYLRNLCVLISNAFSDDDEIRLTLYELYKDNLDRGYLHYEGKLHPNTYGAVSSIAVRIKDFEWALEFIEKYKNDLIGENESQDIYRLNLANYLFGVGRFSECLDNIPATSPFVDYLLHGKRLELKALYELGSELLPYKLDAFRMFLSRTSSKILSDTQKQMNVDFSNLLHQILYSTPGDEKRAERMVKRVEEKKQAAEWRWLLEKAKTLIAA